MWREMRLTQSLQAHDRLLYAKRDTDGIIKVYRKSWRYERYKLENSWLVHSRFAPHLIFSLTDNWKEDGTPVDWGIEPVMNRIREGDLWLRDDLSDVIIKSVERHQESVARDRQNKTESFLMDNRRKFARAWDDINTSSLNKKYDKRRLYDGNR